MSLTRNANNNLSLVNGYRPLDSSISLYHLAEFSGQNLALRVNDKCPKFSFFLKRPY